MYTGRINHIVHTLSTTEHAVATVYGDRSQFDLSDIHYQRALDYARRYEGKKNEINICICIDE
jgi:hypothetical protein